MKDGELLVRKINEGVVIDHIRVGRGKIILSMLGVDEKYRFVLVSNVESRKLGRKDLIKVEGWFPKKEEMEIIALVSGEVTINIVKNNEVVEKFKVSPPSRVEGFVKCRNPRCITNDEREKEFVKPLLEKVSGSPLIYSCHYCDVRMDESEILRNLTVSGR